MNTRTVAMVLMTAACAGAAGGAECAWSQGDVSIGDGKVTIVYDETETSKVKTLVATPANDETLTVTGDAITFAAGATVTMAAPGTLVFANDVAGVGLTCSRTGQQFTYSGAALPAYQNGNPGALMFENLSLDAVTPVASRFSGDLVGVAKPYFIVRESGRLEVQMQSQHLLSSYNAGQTQSAKLVLVQNGSDIYGSVAWTKTNDTDYGDHRGRKDFTDDGTAVDGVVDNLTVEITAGHNAAKVLFTGALSGSVSAKDGAFVAIDVGRAAVAEMFANGLDVGAGSTIEVRNSAGISVTSTIAGSGDVVFENDPVYSCKRNGFFYTAADMDSAYHTTSMVFKTNARLSCLTNVKAVVGCYNKGVLPLAGSVLVSESTFAKTWQIQGLDTSVGPTFKRCATLEFTQVGDDVWVKYASAQQGKADAGSQVTSASPSYSLQKVTASTSDSANGAAVYVYDVELEFSEPIKLAATSLSGINTMDSGEYRAGQGVNLSINAKTALPCAGAVVVGNGANVLLNFNMTEQAYTYGSNTCSFCVKTGGTLRQTARFSLGYMFSIWNDGGVVAFDRVVSSGFDGHLNHVWLKDGASVTAANIYSGKMHAGNFVVYGSSPSTAEVDTLYLYGDNSSTEENPKPRTFMVEVEDVTGDGGADFTFTGRILTPQNVAYTNVTVLKRGSGTWLMSGTLEYVGATLISGGLLKLGRTGTMRASQNVTFINGGGIALAEGVSNSVGKVTLSSSGVLDVPRTSTLVMDSIVNLANGALTVTSELDEAGGQIRILNVPSRSELKRIAYGEFGVTVDANGWLIPKRKRGFVMSVK